MISSLIDVFTKKGLDLDSAEQDLWNIVTGQMFSDEIYFDMVNSEKTGKKERRVIFEFPASSSPLRVSRSSSFPLRKTRISRLIQVVLVLIRVAR